MKVARWRRAERAVRALRSFIQRHMKVEEEKVKLSERLNEYLWHRGAKNPPTKIRVVAKKLEDGKVEVDIYEVEEGKLKRKGEKGKEERREEGEKKEKEGVEEMKKVGKGKEKEG